MKAPAEGASPLTKNKTDTGPSNPHIIKKVLTNHLEVNTQTHTSETPSLPYAKVQIGGRNIKALIDSGATVTVIQQKMLQCGSAGNTKITPTNIQLTGPDDSHIRTYGKGTFEIIMEGESFKIPDIVADIKHQLILGNDFLRQKESIVNFKDKTFQAGDRKMSISSVKHQQVVHAKSFTLIPPFHGMWIEMEDQEIKTDGLMLFSPSNDMEVLDISQIIQNKGLNRVFLINNSSETLDIADGTPLGTIEKVDTDTLSFFQNKQPEKTNRNPC